MNQPAALSYFSIGEYCQTAYQIQRRTSTRESFFFDWLVTTGTSFESIFKNDNEFFQPTNWEIVEHGIRLRDKATDLLFQHEFQVIDKASLIIDATRVEPHLKQAKRKFCYLKAKTLQAIRLQRNVVLIRAEAGIRNEVQAVDRIRQIRKSFSTLNPAIRIVLASAACEAEFRDANQMFFKVDEAQHWTGDDNSWDRLFHEVELHFAPSP